MSLLLHCDFLYRVALTDYIDAGNKAFYRSSDASALEIIYLYSFIQLQNDEVVVTNPVESRIMSFREKQIMIDRDLAELYGVETRVLNQAVKRNIERFPERFRFQLTKEEMNELVTNCDRFNSLKHSTVRSYAFTEQGVNIPLSASTFSQGG